MSLHFELYSSKTPFFLGKQRRSALCVVLDRPKPPSCPSQPLGQPAQPGQGIGEKAAVGGAVNGRGFRPAQNRIPVPAGIRRRKRAARSSFRIPPGAAGSPPQKSAGEETGPAPENPRSGYCPVGRHPAHKSRRDKRSRPPPPRAGRRIRRSARSSPEDSLCRDPPGCRNTGWRPDRRPEDRRTTGRTVPLEKRRNAPA